jgi:hypothetical protein
MYRVELKVGFCFAGLRPPAGLVPNVPCGVESIHLDIREVEIFMVFLMYRVELKVIFFISYLMFHTGS